MPTTDVSLGQLLAGIRKQESGGNYQDVNRSSGALGAYQVMPSNLAAWTRESLGHADTPSQFLHSRSDQDRVASHVLGGYYSHYGARGAASAWYSGNPHLDQSTKSQSGGPSIKGYVDSVVTNAKASAGGLGSGPTGSGAFVPTDVQHWSNVPAGIRNQLEHALRQITDAGLSPDHQSAMQQTIVKQYYHYLSPHQKDTLSLYLSESADESAQHQQGGVAASAAAAAGAVGTAVTDPIKGVGDLIGWLTNPGNLIRVGFVILGFALVLIGVSKLLGGGIEALPSARVIGQRREPETREGDSTESTEETA